jgi:hypothetical protein
MNENAESSLSPRGNLLKVFRHEHPAWIPVHVGHIGPGELPEDFRTGMDPELDASLGRIQWNDGSALVLDESLGFDVLDACGSPVRWERRRASVKHAEQDNGTTTVGTYMTPLGEMREVYRRLREGSPAYCIEHAVKSNDDLPALTAFFEEATPVTDPGALVVLRERKALVGDRGLVFCALQGTPVGMMVRTYAGPETMAYLWADRGDDLRRLFRAMTEYSVREARLCAELGVDLVFNMDDTSTTCISPAMFEEFCMDYTDQMADAVHAHGAFYVHHSCGHIRQLLDLYRQTKMDAVDSLNLAPPRGMGDIPELAEAFERLGPNVAILTGLGLTHQGPDADCAQEIAAAFRDVAPGKNIIFSARGPDFARTKFQAGECRKHQRMYARLQNEEK